jgi:hypothetical protein
MSTNANHLRAPNDTNMLVQQVTRPSVNLLAARNDVPLSWPTIPLDILPLVIEQSPKQTLRNWCLVSKFCNAIATAELYRVVEVEVHPSAPNLQPLSATLKRLVTGAGRHCRKLGLMINPDIYDPVPPAGTLYCHTMIETLCRSTHTCSWMRRIADERAVELALEKTRDLREFRYLSPFTRERRIYNEGDTDTLGVH